MARTVLHSDLVAVSWLIYCHNLHKLCMIIALKLSKWKRCVCIELRMSVVGVGSSAAQRWPVTACSEVCMRYYHEGDIAKLT